MSSRACLASLAAFLLPAVVLSAYCGAATASDKVDPTGTWTWLREFDGQTHLSILKLKVDKGKLTGTYRRQKQTTPITNARFDGNDIAFEVTGKFEELDFAGKFRGKLTKEGIDGEVEVSSAQGGITFSWTAHRGAEFDAITGPWKLASESPEEGLFPATIKISEHNGLLSAAFTNAAGALAAEEVLFDGRELKFGVAGERNGQKFRAMYSARLEGNALRGSVEHDAAGKKRSLPFTAARTGDKLDEKTAANNP